MVLSGVCLAQEEDLMARWDGPPLEERKGDTELGRASVAEQEESSLRCERVKGVRVEGEGGVPQSLVLPRA